MRCSRNLHKIYMWIQLNETANVTAFQDVVEIFEVVFHDQPLVARRLAAAAREEGVDGAVLLSMDVRDTPFALPAAS